MSVAQPPPVPESRSSSDSRDSRDGSAGRAPRRSDRSPWNWLLVLPLLVTLYPPLYNRRTPELGGIPFFYWYQLAVIAVGVLSTLVVYRRNRG